MENRLPDYRWEIIFVDDGSPDQSAQVFGELSAQDEKCRVIELSRNFGKEIALSAGVDYASGDAVICLDADLQHPPERIPDMVLEWENGAEVVEMVREPSKHEPWLRRIGSNFFYIILRLLSSTDILAKIPSTPGSLAEALNALEKDHAFLLEGGVFTKDNIETYISYKRENEVNPMNLRPHPHEFNLYYDA